MSTANPELALHHSLEREKWRRRVEAAGAGDLENLKKIARIMIDGYYGKQLALEQMHRQQLGMPCTAGPQLPNLPKQSH